MEIALWKRKNSTFENLPKLTSLLIVSKSDAFSLTIAALLQSWGTRREHRVYFPPPPVENQLNSCRSVSNPRLLLSQVLPPLAGQEGTIGQWFKGNQVESSCAICVQISESTLAVICSNYYKKETGLSLMSSCETITKMAWKYHAIL